LTTVLRHGTTLQAAEKVTFACVLKGRSFSCAVRVPYFCYHEATLVAEGSAVSPFSAASLAAEAKNSFKANKLLAPIALIDKIFAQAVICR